MPIIYFKHKHVVIAPPYSGSSIYWDSTKTNNAITLSNNNRTMSGNLATSGWVSGLANSGKSADKFVIEFVQQAAAHSLIGFSTVPTLTPSTAGYLGGFANTACIYWTNSSSSILSGGGITSTIGSVGIKAIIGDVFAIAFDMTNGTAKVFKNGVVQNSGNPVWTGLTGKTIYPAGSIWERNSKFTANFTTDTLIHSYPGYVGIGDEQ